MAPRTLACGGAELTLCSAWQLAFALGGSPTIETTADNKVRLQISLPLSAISSLDAENESRLN
jgi:hypothetical protein